MMPSFRTMRWCCVEEALEHADLAQTVELRPQPFPMASRAADPASILHHEEMQWLRKARVISQLASPARRTCSKQQQCRRLFPK